MQQFKPDSFKFKRLSAVIYAPSGSGKTVITSDLLFHWKEKWDQIYLFSPTSNISKDFKFIDIKNHINPTEMDWLSEIERIKSEQTASIELLGKDKVSRVLMIFDDIINQKEIKSGRSTTFESLFILGRHFNIDTFILSQNSNIGSLSLSIRNNANLLICRCRNTKSRKIVIEEYLSLTSTKDGEKLFKQATDLPFSFGVIDIDKSSTSNNVNEYLYSYIAKTNLFKENEIIGKKINKLDDTNLFNNIVRETLEMDKPVNMKLNKLELL
jgi:hypothetical protein